VNHGATICSMPDALPRIRDLLGDSEYKRAEVQFQLQEFESTVAMARIRCLTRQEILGRLCAAPEDPDERALLYRLEESDLATEDAARVAEIATELANFTRVQISCLTTISTLRTLGIARL
jgi:hypothetical protein